MVTEPKRSGIEQLLLSNATDKALAKTEFPQVQGKRIFVSEKYLDSYDKQYVVGSVRAALSENGAHLVNTMEDAEIILEARSGALGIDSSSSLLGIPSFPLVVPAVGSLKIPSVAFLNSEKADSVTKLAFLAYKAKNGEPVLSTESYVGKSYFHKYTFLFVLSVNSTDIPERKNF